MDVTPKDIYLPVGTIESDIVSQYGIYPKRLSLLSRGVSLVYYLEDEFGAKYVLKLLNNKYSTESIELSCNIALYLKNMDFPVPIIYRSIAGAEYSNIGGHNSILMSFLKGKRIGENKENQKMLYDLSDFYGHLTKTLESFPCEMPYPKANKFRLTKDDTVQNRLRTLIDTLGDRDIAFFIQRKMEMLESINYGSDYEFISYVNSIGDFTHFQLLYDENNCICGLLDFDSSKKMPAVYELFRSYIFSTIRYEQESGSFPIAELAAYLNHYLVYHSLSNYDLKYFFYPFYIEMLKSTFGFEQYAINHNDRDALQIGISIYNKCSFLYERIDELCYQLSKEI